NNKTKKRGLIIMARKARFTPREKKSMELLGTAVENSAIDTLEDLMDIASELQDLLYYKSLGVETSKAEVNKMITLYKSAYKEVTKELKNVVLAGKDKEKELKPKARVAIRQYKIVTK